VSCVGERPGTAREEARREIGVIGDEEKQSKPPIWRQELLPRRRPLCEAEHVTRDGPSLWTAVPFTAFFFTQAFHA